MAKALIILALLVLVSTAITFAHAFVLRPSTVTAIGSAKKGKYLWKAQRAIQLSPTIGAVRVSFSKDTCNDRAGECEYGIAYTTDGGETFNIDDSAAATDFCGLGGMKTVAEDGASASVTCVNKLVKADENGLVYSTKTFTFTEGEKTVKIADGEADITFTQPPATTEIPAATSLFAGDTIATFDGTTSTGTFARNVDLTLNNGTVLHSFYKTTDDGLTWEYVSYLPFPMGSESALHVTGATKVMIIAGESNDFKQAVSVFLGSRWEKVENVTYSSPLSTFTSTLGTTVYGGLRGKPGLIGMAAGRKRGTEKLVDFAILHNKVVTRLTNEGDLSSFNGLPVGNFSADFMNATEFEGCDVGGSNADSNGCATSSYTGIVPMGNGSTILAFYDKLSNGYNPSTGIDGEQTLFVMKLALNETKEQNDLDAKLKEEQAAEDKRKAAEERRKQAQKDAEERERQKRRAKNRADKAKKARFAKLDRAPINAAKKMRTVDEDIIIVRSVNAALIEQERDTFFDAFYGVNATLIAEEEEEGKDAKEAAAEEKEAAAEEGAKKEDATEGEKAEEKQE